jgi:hypothetical protein
VYKVCDVFTTAGSPYELTIVDSYGDGWNGGGYVNIYDTSGGISAPLVTQFTVTTDVAATEFSLMTTYPPTAPPPAPPPPASPKSDSYLIDYCVDVRVALTKWADETGFEVTHENADAPILSHMPGSFAQGGPCSMTSSQFSTFDSQFGVSYENITLGDATQCTFRACNLPHKGEITLKMHDSYGDGWTEASGLPFRIFGFAEVVEPYMESVVTREYMIHPYFYTSLELSNHLPSTAVFTSNPKLAMFAVNHPRFMGYEEESEEAKVGKAYPEMQIYEYTIGTFFRFPNEVFKLTTGLGAISGTIDFHGNFEGVEICGLYPLYGFAGCVPVDASPFAFSINTYGDAVGVPMPCIKVVRDVGVGYTAIRSLTYNNEVILEAAY